MPRFSLFLALALLLAGCATTPPSPPGDFDGEWAYTALDRSNGNLWDHGTIRFHGGPDSGTWDLSNAYDYGEEGTWQRVGVTVTLSGDHHWVLRGQDAAGLTGSWDAGFDGDGTLVLRRP